MTGDATRNSRALRQLRLLTEMGCRITVVTLASSGGAPFSDDAVSMIRLPYPQGSGPRFFYRIHRQVKAAVARLSADIYHASDLYVLPALAQAARKTGGRLVFDSREMYPYVYATAGRPWKSLAWHALQDRFVRRAELVLTVSDSIADWLRDTYDIRRPVVMHNVPDLPPPAPGPDRLRERLGISPDRPIALHQGKMQHGRGCDLLLDAFRDVREGVLVFLGDGPARPELEETATRAHADQTVYFVDPVPPAELLAYTAAAQVGVTLLEDTCLNHRYALPNKLFEYLRAGVPVLASELPEISKVVRGFDVGLTVDPADREALVAALRYMLGDSDRRRRWTAHASRALETFSPAQASDRFRSAYHLLLRGAP